MKLRRKKLEVTKLPIFEILNYSALRKKMFIIIWYEFYQFIGCLL